MFYRSLLKRTKNIAFVTKSEKLYSPFTVKSLDLTSVPCGWLVGGGVSPAGAPTQENCITDQINNKYRLKYFLLLVRFLYALKPYQFKTQNMIKTRLNTFVQPNGDVCIIFLDFSSSNLIRKRLDCH